MVTNDDLTLMYESIGTKKHEVLLWCDARSKELSRTSRGSKKFAEATETRSPSKRKIIEGDISETVSELKERHKSNYTMPQIRLWARMIASGNHDSFDDPPSIPLEPHWNTVHWNHSSTFYYAHACLEDIAAVAMNSAEVNEPTCPSMNK